MSVGQGSDVLVLDNEAEFQRRIALGAGLVGRASMPGLGRVGRASLSGEGRIARANIEEPARDCCMNTA